MEEEMRMQPINDDDRGPEMLAMIAIFVIGMAFGSLIGFFIGVSI